MYADNHFDMRVHTMSSFVAVIKGERGHEPVFKALDLIDYKSALAGWDKVLIKVNFITDKTWDTGAKTDPIVVEAIIKKLKICLLRFMLWSQTLLLPALAKLSKLRA